MPILPKVFGRPSARAAAGIRVSPLLVEAARADTDSVLRTLTTTAQGLSEAEVLKRREQYGPNVIVSETRYRRLKLLGHAIINPLVILLLILAAVTFATANEPS